MPKVIGVFDEQSQAEKAVNEIKRQGISDGEISIAAKKDSIAQERGDNNYLDQDLTTGAGIGGSLGGVAGLMTGVGALAIPGIGPLLAAGPIAAGLTGAAAGGLAGGLVDMGIPEDRGDYYENQVKEGAILAMVESDQDKIDPIASLMREQGARDVETH